jgi:uncharacterized protein (DUF4415 family)
MIVKARFDQKRTYATWRKGVSRLSLWIASNGIRPLLPKLFAKKTATQLLTPKRGRPPSLTTKEHINIRIDADVLTAFKKSGAGWQTRVNDALREWLKTHA